MNESSVAFGLAGYADIVARTSVGDIPISDVRFSVTTHLGGSESFGSSATLSDITISGSGKEDGNEYIVMPLNVAMRNASNIHWEIANVQLAVYYEDVQIGRLLVKVCISSLSWPLVSQLSQIQALALTPGENHMAAELRYQPNLASDKTSQEFLSAFLQQNDAIPLTIKGDATSVAFASLKPVFGLISLSTSAPGTEGFS